METYSGQTEPLQIDPQVYIALLQQISIIYVHMQIYQGQTEPPPPLIDSKCI